jgi:hypothetical protein
MQKDHEYQVEGRWPFPADIMLGDGSRPATAEDARKIERLTRDNVDSLAEARERVVVHLVIPQAGPRQRPLADRWNHLDWAVVSADPAEAGYQRLLAHNNERKALRRSAASKLTVEERDALGIDEDGSRTDDRH